MPKIFGFPTGLSTFKVNLRLEPICRSGSKLTGISARIADPMWLLARQWQMGEFLGEDAGSPVSVEVTYSTQPVGRLRHGDEATLEPIDRPSPIEVLVEKEASPLDWRLRVQIWQQLERAIWATLKNEAPAIIELLKNNNIFKIALPAPDDEAWLGIDPETESYLRFMQNRALDGGAILQNINKLPEKLIKGAKEEDGPTNIVNKWCKKLNISISQPPKPKSWRTAQMDYKFTLNDGKTALIAPSYRNGNLDWYSFNVGKSTINPNPWPAPKTERKLATRIAVRGTSPRWLAFEDGSMNLDWPGLARQRQTVVIYMGLSGLPQLCAKLMEHGLPADWPAAIVQHGTQPSQRTITGTLTTLPELANAAKLRAPTLIIVGEVVTLRDKLRWFTEDGG